MHFLGDPIKTPQEFCLRLDPDGHRYPFHLWSKGRSYLDIQHQRNELHTVLFTSIEKRCIPLISLRSEQTKSLLTLMSSHRIQEWMSEKLNHN